MIEKIIFSILAIALFTITFFKLIKKNDTSYIYLLVIEFLGIAISFIELISSFSFHWIIKIFTYLFSIILPCVLFWLEKFKKMDFPELFHITLAKIYEKAGNQEKAKEIISNFLNKNRNSYAAHKFLAEIYQKENNKEAAISEYMVVIELNRKDVSSAYQLASIFEQNKQKEEAITLLQEILRQQPEYEQATNLLGDIFFTEERYKEAVSVYMEALRYHPTSYDLYYNLGMVYTMMNDFQRANEFYAKAAEINTMAYNAKLSLGQIALIYGDLETAEKYFRESAKQEDLESGSYYYLSQIALLKGDEDKAKNYMNLAVQLDANMYNQMQKDPLFLPIRNEITPPQKVVEEQTQKMKKMTLKEQRVNRHLVETCILVGSLSNEDLKLMRRKKQEQIEKEQKQKE